MKANELSADQLATLIDVTMRSEHDETELDALLESYGIEPSGDGSQIFIEIARRLRTLTALEAKIKGMIDRPKVEVVEVQWGQGTATLEINGVQLFVNRDEWDAVEATFDTKALGMEGGE
jgi:hypothetical protein